MHAYLVRTYKDRQFIIYTK